jgi:hypothetical protein
LLLEFSLITIADSSQDGVIIASSSIIMSRAFTVRGKIFIMLFFVFLIFSSASRWLGGNLSLFRLS